jgi:tetratricopeptide (TPR) repeat protein
MSDPLRTDSSRSGEPASDADREAKIEQLLLAGLDHYLGSRYEQAINVWTRALFLDRNHARARAYIERARSALAERQRESEELIHSGVAAFDRGEADEARRLLQAAVTQGAPTDEALVVLERLNRLERRGPDVASHVTTRTRTPVRPRPASDLPAARSRAAWIALATLTVIIVASVAFALGAFRSDWRSVLDRPVVSPSSPLPRPAGDQAPSLPRRGEMALTRAHSFAAAGRLRDALATLDLVSSTDAEKADADRFRAEIQRRLIALGASPAPSPASTDEATVR